MKAVAPRRKREANVGVIPAAFGVLASNYPRRDVQNPALYQYVDQAMKTLPGTPCCVQMSHALNMAGIRIPPRSYRRPNTALTINGNIYYYLAATDELEKFMMSLCGDGGEVINKDLSAKRSIDQIKKYIAGRTGLLLFRFSSVGVIAPKEEFEHTELWDGTKILQRDMDERFLFGRPRVLMWDTFDPASWLVNYMNKFAGSP
jgi:Type VI secretion system (T6SS), amidase effector protein 4